MKKSYDIIIVGGGAAGCAAAYTAGTLGLKTLLIEKSGVLGGSMTSGLVIPAMAAAKNSINTSFFNDLIKIMKKFGGQISYLKNPGWFNPEILKIALDELLAKSGVDLLFNTTICNVNLINKHIESIDVTREILSAYNYTLYDGLKTLSVNIGTRYLVDTTGNCEIGKILNCNFLENEKDFQPFSLRFIMSGIDLGAYSSWLYAFDTDRSVTTVEEIDGSIHLSTAYTWDSTRKWALEPIFRDAIEKNILKPNDINYFQVFTIPGMHDSLAFNCPRIVDIEPNIGIASTSKALTEGRKAIFRLSKFCKEYFPGFEKAYISNISDMLGIRTSRRIKGKYVYTMNDIISGKKFKNPVAIADYPIDVHSKEKNCSTLKKVGEYQIPIEALMSADIDNLYIAGRCISCDFMAQGAIRIQPTCFSMGEGVAKYIKEQLTP